MRTHTAGVTSGVCVPRVLPVSDKNVAQSDTREAYVPNGRQLQRMRFWSEFPAFLRIVEDAGDADSGSTPLRDTRLCTGLTKTETLVQPGVEARWHTEAVCMPKLSNPDAQKAREDIPFRPPACAAVAQKQRQPDKGRVGGSNPLCGTSRPRRYIDNPFGISTNGSVRENQVASTVNDTERALGSVWKSLKEKRFV